MVRLVGAVLAEQTDGWAEGCGYISLDLLTESRAATTPHAVVSILIHHAGGRDPCGTS